MGVNMYNLKCKSYQMEYYTMLQDDDNNVK